MRFYVVIPVVLAFFLVSCQGTRPDNLGAVDGKLGESPDKPNCVFSESKSDDHRIQPLEVMDSAEASIEKLTTIIQGMERTRVIEKKENYLYAEFESNLFKFVDDVEFYIPENGSSIQVRSASRIGYSDRGVNRERIDAIRASYSTP